MKRIFVCSPLRGDYDINISNAKYYCWEVANSFGHAPFAPHLLYTQFLNDDVESERIMAIEAGIMFLKCCDEVWVFGKPEGEETSGMKHEIKYAKAIGVPVRYIDDIVKEFNNLD
jgi:hypothetical protein